MCVRTAWTRLSGLTLGEGQAPFCELGSDPKGVRPCSARSVEQYARDVGGARQHRVVAAGHRKRFPTLGLGAVVELPEGRGREVRRKYVAPPHAFDAAREAQALLERRERLHRALRVDPGAIFRADVEELRGNRRRLPTVAVLARARDLRLALL